jgi:2-polyprenyl-3-methyl-5-hydroxy-6-metoxy-1,4-benzoquinol methylase
VTTSLPWHASDMIDPIRLEKYNYQSRFQKARKIERILLDFLGGARDAQNLRCLDLGCSIGVISIHLAEIFGQVVGIDPIREALDIARLLDSEAQVQFIHSDGLDLCFEDETFDVIICAQVYEHTSDPAQLVSEIRRVLAVGGCCFFSGPNSLWPIEYHYHWCCLHWLPRSLLSRYCQYRYDHAYDLTLYNYWRLRGLWEGFQCCDYTLRLVYEAERFLGSPNHYRLARLVPRSLASSLRFLLPNFNWMLRKL